jgi:proton-dependent oligopeptide transporter, POT family
MGVLAFISGILLWFSVRKLDAQEDELNMLNTGHLATEKHVHHTEGEDSA